MSCNVNIPDNPVPSPARPATPTELDRYLIPTPSTPTGAGFQRDDLDGVGDYDSRIVGDVNPVQPPATPPPANTAYGSVASVIENSLRQNWQERGRPPNPLIAEAFSIAGGGEISVDGPKTNPWCAAYATWVLWKSGLEFNNPGIGSQSYLRYGKTVNWRNYVDIRKYDLVIFTRKEEPRRGHAAFVHSIDPQKNQIRVYGGNQSNTVKLSNFSIYQQNTTGLFVNQIRRNWDIPAEFDVPLVAVPNNQRTNSAPNPGTAVTKVGV